MAAAPMQIVNPSFVSSNGYYGYVPPINDPAKHHNNYQELQQARQHQSHHQAVCFTNNHNFNDVAASCHVHQQQHYEYNNGLSAMETDDQIDQCLNEDTHCQNNHCVIPETARRHIDDGGGNFIYRVTCSNALSTPCDSSIPSTSNTSCTPSTSSSTPCLPSTSSYPIGQRSRKRNSYDDPAALIGHIKKLRQGGGNKCVCHGTGSRRDGSTAVYNESTALCLVFNRTSPKKRASSLVDCCTQAAGNNLLNNKPREIIHEARNPIINMYNVDYETMLMETHGCSAYHHHHHHLLSTDTIEAEF